MLPLFTLAACGPGPTDGEPEPSGSIRAGLDLDIVDFGYVPAGASAEASLVLTSGGSEALTIDTVTTSNPAFTVDDTALGALEAGASMTFTVHFAPTESIAYAGTFDVVSDAPLPLTAQLLGTADESPVAVCEAIEDHVVVGESAYFSGADSTDPTDDPLTWSWSLLSSPTGSVATLAAMESDATITTDVLGDYTVQLLVTDATGLSSTCTSTVTAGETEYIPGLYVELTWTQAGDDLDLHVVRDDGPLRSANDCYYATCTYAGLDWGEVEVREDDPTMIRDDITGTGPEEVVLEAPADESYTIYVHDYAGSVRYESNPALVRVYWDSVLLGERTVRLDDEDEYIAAFVVVTADQSIPEP